MIFTREGITATHDEMVAWLEWYGQRMVQAQAPRGHVQNFQAQAADWLSSGVSYMKRNEPKCEVCKGTGKSKLYLADSSTIECKACQGTGLLLQTEEIEI